VGTIYPPAESAASSCCGCCYLTSEAAHEPSLACLPRVPKTHSAARPSANLRCNPSCMSCIARGTADYGCGRGEERSAWKHTQSPQRQDYAVRRGASRQQSIVVRQAYRLGLWNPSHGNGTSQRPKFECIKLVRGEVTVLHFDIDTGTHPPAKSCTYLSV
jgi:uncharacterized cupin superfamily protein